MKSQKILFIPIILFACLQFCFAQEKPEAKLFDHFSKVNCEDFWARFDNFFVKLQNEPDSVGYIIIYGEKNSLRVNLGYEKLTDGIVRFRNLDRSRLIIVRGEEKVAIHIEFWSVPAGADKPNFIEGSMNLTVKQNKPFILNGYSEGNDICPTNTSIKLFADYLSANPSMLGHLIITDKSNKNSANTEKDLLNHLISQHKISRNRLKVFHVKDRNYPYDFSNIEFWLVPQKTK